VSAFFNCSGVILKPLLSSVSISTTVPPLYLNLMVLFTFL